MTALPPCQPDPWHEIVGLLGQMTEDAFLKRWNKPITFEASRLQRPDGTSTIAYGFRFHRPGLMPTALEREWFQSFVSGYQAAINVMLHLLDPPDRAPPS